MKYRDRSKQQTTSTGTGAMTLGATPASFVSLVTQFASEERFLYVIQGPSEWEIGIGYVSSGTLVRENPLEGSSSVPISFSSGVKDIFNADYAATVGGSHWSVFGDGIDGDVYINEPVTLDDNMFYRNLTLGPLANILVNGFKIRVSGVLDTVNAVTGAIRATGDLGGDGVLDALGAGGAGALPSYNGGSQAGANGAAGKVGAGSVGSSPASPGVYLGGRGGSGGAGGDSAAALAGGAASARPAAPTFRLRFGLNDRMIATTNTAASMVLGGSGGAGGSSGAGDSSKGGSGGGGGAGGGVIDIAAAVLRPGDGTGVLLADGRNGGDAGDPTDIDAGGGGGGAGGGGGFIRAVFGHVLDTAVGFASAPGGNGGQGSLGQEGLGENGDGGYGGDGGRVELHKIVEGVRSTTDGSAGGVNNLYLGGTGGFCLVNV